MTDIFIVKLWRRSRPLALVMTVLLVVVVLLAAAGVVFGWRPTPNQSWLYGTVVGFTLGLGFAAQILPEKESGA